MLSLLKINTVDSKRTFLFFAEFRRRMEHGEPITDNRPLSQGMFTQSWCLSLHRRIRAVGAVFTVNKLCPSWT
jgi:hypothetical protein